MASVQLGDLAQSHMLRSENARLKQQTAILTKEMSTGRVQDLAAKVSGDLTVITGIEHDLSRLDGYATAHTESVLMTDSLQTALSFVQDMSEGISSGLTLVGTASDPTAAHSAGVAASEAFGSIVGTLGVQVGGRSVLSGVATDRSALAPAADILAALKTATAGMQSADDVAATVDAWFGPGGDFETVGYTGAPTPLSPIPVGRNTELSMTLTAADSRLRDVMAAAALGALVAEGSISSNASEKVELAAIAGRRLQSAQSGMATIRAEVGSMQSKLETVEQANATARHALEIAHNDIVLADPYDTATRLEETQTQLETLYAITARLSRMTLMDFLR